jgi:hypothetical protein
MASNIEIIKEELATHREFLVEQFERWHPEIIEQPSVRITEIMYVPEDADGALEFLELENTTGREIDLGGWTIDGIDFRFPAPGLVAEGARVVVARDPARLRARYPERDLGTVYGPFNGRLDNDGELLRVVDDGPGYPATIEYLRYGVGGEWPAIRRGHSIVLDEGRPDNGAPGAWRLSAEVGGEPGQVGVRFRRGDVVPDGVVEIGDGIAILGHLFLGSGAPACADAADVDDSGVVEIADAIYLLQFLFLGRAEPAPPFSEPGFDPTTDSLDCEAPAL